MKASDLDIVGDLISNLQRAKDALNQFGQVPEVRNPTDTWHTTISWPDPNADEEVPVYRRQKHFSITFSEPEERMLQDYIKVCLKQRIKVISDQLRALGVDPTL